MSKSTCRKILVVSTLILITFSIPACVAVSGSGSSPEDCMIVAKKVLSDYGPTKTDMGNLAVLGICQDDGKSYTVLAKVENLGTDLHNRKENYWVNIRIYPQHDLASVNPEVLEKAQPLRTNAAKKLEFKLQDLITNELDLRILRASLNTYK